MILSLLLSILSGCSNTPHGDKVTGTAVVKVTFGGEPVTEGFVNFENPNTGLGGGAELEASGMATVPSIPVGDYTVSVIPPLPPDNDPNPKMKEYDNLPIKFRSSTSTLKATIKEGSNEFAFELKEE
tara:strand:+ start:2878 stop:3258 length:381 start_codon:yes stop_codon:yes gene_type:complete